MNSEWHAINKKIYFQHASVERRMNGGPGPMLKRKTGYADDEEFREPTTRRKLGEMSIDS